ncbi:MAG TPA: hypothetical protein VEG08_02410 [Terriglobales bacterium]|nr:hypothetical protein [Terriglobales bacterium]
MPIQVERSNFDPQDGRYQYYVAFKGNTNREEAEVHHRVPIEVAVSVSETGDLADLSFEVPKKYRNEVALTFIKREAPQAHYVDPRVFVAIPGLTGDAVLAAVANLELDAAGRIIGMDIH